jgi:hypothetical protein
MLVSRRDPVRSVAETRSRAGSAPLKWAFLLPLALVANIIVAVVAWRLVGLLLG